MQVVLSIAITTKSGKRKSDQFTLVPAYSSTPINTTLTLLYKTSCSLKTIPPAAEIAHRRTSDLVPEVDPGELAAHHRGDRRSPFRLPTLR